MPLLFIRLKHLACVIAAAFTTIAVAGAQPFFLDAPYTYRVRNWQPADYRVDERTWERTLAFCHERLDENPDDLDALLLRAVAYREFGVRRALLLRMRDWKRSEADFQALLAKDSMHQDVYFQYAHLKRYKGDLEEALDLMHRQAALRPDLPYVVPALLRLYRQFILEKKPADVDAWLEAHPSDYATFFRAGRFARAGALVRADSILSDLLLRRRQLPYPPILLARARIYYALDRPDIAQAYVMQAIETIGSETDARLVAEDFKYIFTDDEVDRFLRLHTPEEYRSFFLRMWEQRNPARSEPVNRRLRVHYQRLIRAERELAYYASREAYRVMNNVRMDRMADRDFPAAYWLNGELGDKGLIYVRHGAPNATAHSVSRDTPFIESWRYLNPDMDFHFEGFSNLAELIPLLPMDIDALEAREMWGGVYVRLARAVRQRDGLLGVDRSRMTEMDLMTFGNEMFDQSLEDARAGLSSDRHRWPASLRHLNVPHVLTAFRGEDGKTRLEVYYAIPIGEIVPQLEHAGERIALHVGVAVDDTLWSPVFKSYETLNVPATTDPSIAAIDYIGLDVPPDSYHVNLHVQIDASDWLGSYQFDYRIRDLTGDALALSDILPASSIMPADRGGRYVKNGLLIQANPTATYRKDDPLFVYFEIYNLAYSSDDRTNYQITYTLQKPAADRPRRRLFRRKSDPVLSLTFEREGNERNAVEYGEIDMRAVPEGTYDLVVTVTDRTTGMQAMARRSISLKN